VCFSATFNETELTNYAIVVKRFNPVVEKNINITKRERSTRGMASAGPDGGGSSSAPPASAPVKVAPKRAKVKVARKAFDPQAFVSSQNPAVAGGGVASPPLGGMGMVMPGASTPLAANPSMAARKEARASRLVFLHV